MNHARDNDMPMYSALTDMPESLSSRPRKWVGDFFMLMTMLVAMKEAMPVSEFVPMLVEKTGRELVYGVHFTVGVKEGGAFRTLTRLPDIFEVEIEVDGARHRFRHPEPADAYAQAVLFLLARIAA